MLEKRGDGVPRRVVQQPISVASAAESDDTLVALKALRDKLARDIDECRSKRDIASLSRQLSTVLDKIEAWKPSRTAMRDQLAAKRAARRTAVATARNSPDSGGSNGH